MRHYRISRFKKNLQMRKAKFTRIRRYGGDYMSRHGIMNVTKNLNKARLVKALKKSSGMA